MMFGGILLLQAGTIARLLWWNGRAALRDWLQGMMVD